MIACRHCGSEAVRTIGALPPGPVFAGRVLPIPAPGGYLRRCLDCGFVFRDPVPTDEQLTELYARGDTQIWAGEQVRIDFGLVRQHVGSTGGSVLDVGCYTGDLLASLPASISRHGVEPNVAAAVIARQRSINVVGSDISDVVTKGLSFDVVVACDVIEHVSRPADFLAMLLKVTRPGGRIVIATGNPDARLWRLCGARFWYCHFPEHISFVGEAWMRKVAEGMGLVVEAAIPYNYTEPNGLTLRSMLRIFGAVAYAVVPSVVRMTHRLRAWLRDSSYAPHRFAPPGCGATRDHILFVLSR